MHQPCDLHTERGYAGWCAMCRRQQPIKPRFLSRPHVLYRMFTDDGDLLYIGATINPKARLQDHELSRSWWQHVAKITLEHFPDQDALHEGERRAIAAEMPAYNIHHNALAASSV